MSDADDTKECPFCAEVIKRKAIKCRFCGSMLNETVDAPSLAPPSDSPPASAGPDLDPSEVETLTGEPCWYCRRATPWELGRCQHCGQLLRLQAPSSGPESKTWLGSCFHDFVSLCGSVSAANSIQQAEIWTGLRGRYVRWSGTAIDVRRVDGRVVVLARCLVTPELMHTRSDVSPHVVLRVRPDNEADAVTLTRGKDFVFSGRLDALAGEGQVELVDGRVWPNEVMAGKYLPWCYCTVLELVSLHNGVLKVMQEEGGTPVRLVARLMNSKANYSAFTTNPAFKTHWLNRWVIWRGELKQVNSGILTGSSINVKFVKTTLTWDADVHINGKDLQPISAKLKPGVHVTFVGQISAGPTIITGWTIRNGQVLAVGEEIVATPGVANTSTTGQSGRLATANSTGTATGAVVTMHMLEGQIPERALYDCPGCGEERSIWPQRLMGNPKCSSCGTEARLEWI